MSSSEGQPKSEGTSQSYGQILKSTSIVGGAQGINLLLGIVRVKFAAVLIGPVGVGLVGNFQAVQGVVAILAGFGIQTSAVRDVAQAISEGNPARVGRSILALSRFCWLSGLLGAALIAGFSPLLSQWSFGSRAYTAQIAWLAVVILLGNLTGAQMALTQGMRRVGDLAKIQIVGAAAGTVITIVAYSWLGTQGIIPSLLLMGAVQYVISWQVARQIALPPVKASWRESLADAGGMARLGFVFMWNGLVGSLVLYLTRAWITQDLGIAAVGIFGAAFGLSGMLMNFILNAMGADYYPRLTGFVNDTRAMVRLVNEQTEIGLLLALPGLMATLGLAPWLVRLLYSSEFEPAVGLLHWFVLGCLGRVISWPLAYVLLALHKSRLFFVVETAFNGLHLLLIWLSLQLASLEGVAIAFFVSYVIYSVIIYKLCGKLINFRWSSSSLRLLSITIPIVAAGFCGVRMLPDWLSVCFSLFLTFASSFFCLCGLINRIGYEHSFVRQVFKIPCLRRACRFSLPR